MRDNFRLGEWLVQPQLNTVSFNGTSSRLEPRAMEVLLYLARNRGEVVSKEQIIQDVWGGRFVTEEVMTNSIFELRKALGDEARNPRFIQTIPKRGYRLIAPVTSDQPPEAHVLQPSRRWKLATAAALILASAIVALWLSVWSRESTSLAESFRIDALAVLPFEDLSSQAEQDYFADGMTEALIAELSRLLPVRVISRTSVMQYKGVDKPVSEIGRELNVDAIVEGNEGRQAITVGGLRWSNYLGHETVLASTPFLWFSSTSWDSCLCLSS
ncbi:MAG TPA: winged helix-turn-helix domain-containing protein [Blastocatellia bacterium]|nr:winged helix-turn-helix domain-containing protein [Blastocatellia bacterium]